MNMKSEKVRPINVQQQNLEFLIQIPSFKRVVLSIRRKFEVPERGLRTEKQRVKWEAENAPKHDTFLKYIYKLKRLFNLTDYFTDSLTFYVKWGEVTEFIGQNFLVIRKLNLETQEWELYLRLYEHTRVGDIVQNWPEILDQQRKLPNYSKHSKPKDPLIVKRELFIINELDRGNNKVSDIAEKLSQVYPNPTLEEEAIFQVVDDTIKQVIKKYKRRFKGIELITE